MSSEDDWDVERYGNPREFGPRPTFVQVAQPYIFEQRIQECLKATNLDKNIEAQERLNGVTWIDRIRNSLNLPIKIFNTGCVYYQRFRLVHKQGSYDPRDVAAASVMAACKVEDTNKKPRDVVSAAQRVFYPAGETNLDSSFLDNATKQLHYYEKFHFEITSYDFRSRHPNKVLMNLCRQCGLEKESIGWTAWLLSLDLYRTYAPLKQTRQTMAFACLELALRLHDTNPAGIESENLPLDYDSWHTQRAEVLETLFDLLDIYQYDYKATLLSRFFEKDKFMRTRIPLTREAGEIDYPRYTCWKMRLELTENPISTSEPNMSGSNGSTANALMTPTSPQDRPQEQHGFVPYNSLKLGSVRYMIDPRRATQESEQTEENFELMEDEDGVEMVNGAAVAAAEETESMDVDEDDEAVICSMYDPALPTNMVPRAQRLSWYVRGI